MERLKARSTLERFRGVSLEHALFTLALSNLLATVLNSNCIGAVREVGCKWNV